MRSLLFVPAHDDRKLTKALDSGADALILDLEDSVPGGMKERARATCAAFVAGNRERMPLFVRVNPLASGLVLDDLAACVRVRPFGVMLPKSSGAADVHRLDAFISALEARDDVVRGSVRILPIVTETAAALFDLGSYAREPTPRLFGLMWGGEDLATDLGAASNREQGRYTPPFELARSLCLLGAAGARVAAIDTIYADFRDDGGLREECRAAAVAGFVAKAAIHPAQVPIINEAFTPSADAVREAIAVVEAFSSRPDAGAVSIGGRMLDRPHLVAAERVLARAGRKAAS